MGGLGGKWICCYPQLGGIMTRIIKWAGVQWCLQMFREMFDGTESALSQSSCTFIAQLMGTGAENPACFQLENGCWHVLFIKCLLCLLSTVICSCAPSPAPSSQAGFTLCCHCMLSTSLIIVMEWTPGHSMHKKGFWVSFWDVQARNEWAPDNSQCRVEKAMVTSWFDLGVISPSPVVVILRCCLGESWEPDCIC